MTNHFPVVCPVEACVWCSNVESVRSITAAEAAMNVASSVMMNVFMVEGVGRVG